ncbi:MAG TPA: HD domain-containing phosphohydrolase [Mariprofundaceae bacterium]|nr:HD domain-containing phosphohydrolase [Mariprofundaceae bacterium]
MAQILVVDDNEAFRKSLDEMLVTAGYTVAEAATGEEAVHTLETSIPDLIISDLLMPGIDGFELCRHVRSSESLPNIPFIFCSGFFPRKEQKELARLLEVEDFFDKPVDLGRLLAAVEKNLTKSSAASEKHVDDSQKFFSTAHADLVQSKLWGAIEQERKQRTRAEALVAKLQKNLESFIASVAKAVEARDPYTAGHQRRVATLATAIAEEMGLDKKRVTGIRLGAIIHDIGKIYVPAELLVKPSALSPIEFEIIKSHTKVGYDILSDIDSPWPLAEIACQHHERIDGSGYPKGLKNGEIILEAKVIAVADVVEAMLSHRPYRAALATEAAIEEIKVNRGVFYDADAVDACLKVFDRGLHF